MNRCVATIALIALSFTASCVADPGGLVVPLDGKPIKITTTTTETATGTGIGGKAQGDNASLAGHDFSAPSVHLQEGTAALGASGSLDVSAKITGGSGFRLGIGIFGALLIIAGIAGSVYLGWAPTTMIGCVLVGSICIARALFPVVGELLTVGGLLVSTVFWLKSSHSGASVLAAFKSSINRIDGIRNAVPSVAQGMAEAAKLAKVPDLTPLAQKIIDKETVT